MGVERDPAVSILARWGLVAGRQVQGLTLADTRRKGAALEIVFRRGEGELIVDLQPASEERHAARVGALDLVVRRAAGELAPTAPATVRLLAAWLTRHGNGNALLPHLGVDAAAEVSPARPEAASAPAAEESAAYHDDGEAPELDPAKETRAERPFFRFETIDAGEVGRFPDAIREMYSGTFGGLLIRNVYAAEEMATIAAALENGGGGYPRTSFPARFKAHFFGRCLDGSDPGLDVYLDDAARFRDETLALFGAAAPFEARIEEVIGRLAGARAVQVPRFRDGRAYSPATIRILLEGGQIGTHCGNEAATRPAYTHLNEVIDRGDQISYFLTLQAPQGGGELVVYSLKWSDIDASQIIGGRTQVNPFLGEAEWMAISPRAGDLLVFDGGRYFHRVAKVKGSRTRYTIGGFMMFDQPGETLLYWS